MVISRGYLMLTTIGCCLTTFVGSFEITSAVGIFEITSSSYLQESTKDCPNWQQLRKQTLYLPLDKIYSQHFQALQHAGIVNKKIPTLTKQLQHNEEAKAVKQAKDQSNNKYNRRRTTYFCIGYSNIWSKPVRSIIETVKDKFNSNGWECLCLTTDLPTLEKSFKEIYPGNSQSA